jgi:hypothetical protein
MKRGFFDLLDPSNDPEFFWQVISGPPCIGTLVAFRQHCTRLVQRYLQTSDGKVQKLLVEHHLHLQKM